MDRVCGPDEGISDLPLLDFKILCKTAIIPEVCPLRPPHICEEVQFTPDPEKFSLQDDKNY